jgi:curved DNA-binding protein
MFGEMGGFSDFFRTFFAGGGSSRQSTGQRNYRQQYPQQQPPSHYQQDLTISLYEAYHGAKRIIQIGDQKIEVKIPAGAKTGTKVRVAGVGPGDRQGVRGDLYLVIQVAHDHRFAREGDDLHTKVHVDFVTAVLGGETEVETMTGKVSLKIPAGTQPGQKMRLKNKGMPIIKNKEKFGDLIVTAQVDIPKKLSDQEKDLFNKLKEIRS